MRFLPVFLLVPALLFLAINAGASSIDDLLVVSFHTYAEDTSQKIFSTKGSLVRRLSDQWGLAASLGVDTISGATPSAGASSGGEEDDDDDDEGEELNARVYPSLSLRHDDGVNIGAFGAYYSAESDYTGQSLFIDYTHVMNVGNTAAGVSINQASDKWKVSGITPDNRDERTVSLTLSQTLSPRVQARLVWTNIYSDGYLGNPNRYVDIGPTRVLERLPEEKNSDAMALRLVTLLSESTSFHLGYRYYSDDWSISSRTVDTALYRDVSARWTVGGRLRFYTQTEADFIKPIADIQTSDEVVAIDYKNTAFDTYTAGVEFHYKPVARKTKLIDWDKARIKGGFDLYTTSSNDFIDNWYGEDSITGAMVTVSMEYDY